MIAKINTGSNLYGALAYNQEKVDEGLGKVLATNLVCEPMDGCFSVQTTAADFARWLPSPEHLPTKKSVIHISLNPHPDDKLADNQLGTSGVSTWIDWVTAVNHTSFSSMRTSGAII